MFTGLDDIDWESLRHAYGSVESVPGWVRGLVDSDPAVREESLDAMYGAVHHCAMFAGGPFLGCAGGPLP